MQYSKYEDKYQEFAEEVILKRIAQPGETVSFTKAEAAKMYDYIIALHHARKIISPESDMTYPYTSQQREE